jgi:hypothetical protein
VGIGFFVLITVTFGGHEVLHKWSEKHDGILKPEELLIIQFDSRPLDNYWLVTSQWNAHYAARYGHHYQFVTGNDQPCTSCDGSTIGQAWCKLKTMLMIDTTAAKTIKAILYLDSDAVITVNHSMSTVISYIKQDLHWDISKMPMAFNQDGPGFACKQTISLGYSKCFNSGIVLWFRHPQSTKLLRDWWSAASIPFGQMQTISRFPMDWKLNVYRLLSFYLYLFFFFSLFVYLYSGLGNKQYCTIYMKHITRRSWHCHFQTYLFFLGRVRRIRNLSILLILLNRIVLVIGQEQTVSSHIFVPVGNKKRSCELLTVP